MLAHFILFVRGCTQRVCSAQAVCSLAGPRSIKSIPGRFQVKRHSRDVAYQAFPLSACNIERWVWPGDEASYRRTGASPSSVVQRLVR